MTAAGQFGPVTLETERLTIRPVRVDDAPAIVRGCSDPLTQHWLPLPRPYRQADALAWIDRAEAQRLSGVGLHCATTLAGEDEMVVWVGLKKTDWESLVTEVGYWTVPEHRGQGYVSEATRALSSWALTQGMERVELLAAPDNLPSNRAAVRAGFSLEGTKRNAGYVHGGRVDLNLYSLIRADLEAGGR